MTHEMHTALLDTVFDRSDNLITYTIYSEIVIDNGGVPCHPKIFERRKIVAITNTQTK